AGEESNHSPGYLGSGATGGSSARVRQHGRTSRPWHPDVLVQATCTPITGDDPMTIHRLLAAGLGALSLALAPAARGADDVAALAARIDQRLAAGWGKDVAPAPPADAAEFFRRLSLDHAGRIPSVTEARDFLDDDLPDKRRLWVERILRADPDDESYRDAYANHFAN